MYVCMYMSWYVHMYCMYILLYVRMYIHISVHIQLTHVLRLSNAVKYDLFPTTEMVVGLSAEFGVPATFEDLACELV